MKLQNDFHPPTCPIKGILFGQDPQLVQQIWGAEQRARLHCLVDLPPEILTPSQMQEHADWLSQTEVVFSTWSMPLLSPEQLDLMPRLKAVFYAGGTVKGFAEPLFDRGILVVSGWAANAIPVAEYTLSQILFSLKQGWRHVRQLQGDPAGWKRLPSTGAYQATVGIISLGMVGRKVCELLQPFSLRKLIYDPFVQDAALSELGGARAGLKELFANSDVVTLHTPWLKETEGMITGELFASMKPNATFINTSRGAVVQENEMVEVLQNRPDLTAILDVTHPEPPEPDSPLYHMPNVVLTPHIAGAQGNEFLRLADWMMDEFVTWQKGQPLRYAVLPELMSKSA